MKKQYGLTLVELLITIAIVAILITVVGPNMRDMLVKNRVISQINEVSSMIQYARSTAVNEQTTTIICPSQDFTDCSTDWSNAKMVFIDANADGTRNANEDILAGTEINEGTIMTTGPALPIRFSATGVTASPATILICHDSKEAKFARALAVSLQGRVKTSDDSNNDGIYEDNSGNPLDCN